MRRRVCRLRIEGRKSGFTGGCRRRQFRAVRLAGFEKRLRNAGCGFCGNGGKSFGKIESGGGESAFRRAPCARFMSGNADLAVGGCLANRRKQNSFSKRR